MNKFQPTKTEKALCISLTRLWKETGHKQETIGAAAGVGGPYISMLIGGKRGGSIEVWDKIANFFGTTIPQMITDGQETPPPKKSKPISERNLHTILAHGTPQCIEIAETMLKTLADQINGEKTQLAGASPPTGAAGRPQRSTEPDCATPSSD